MELFTASTGIATDATDPPPYLMPREDVPRSPEREEETPPLAPPPEPTVCTVAEEVAYSPFPDDVDDGMEAWP